MISLLCRRFALSTVLDREKPRRARVLGPYINYLCNAQALNDQEVMDRG